MRVRDVRLRAPRGALVPEMANAWVDQVTGWRRSVEQANERGVESVSAIFWQAVAFAVDVDAKHECFAYHLEAVQPKEAMEPTSSISQSVLGRHAHADGGPSGEDPPSAQYTRGRSVS